MSKICLKISNITFYYFNQNVMFQILKHVVITWRYSIGNHSGSTKYINVYQKLLLSYHIILSAPFVKFNIMHLWYLYICYYNNIITIIYTIIRFKDKYSDLYTHIYVPTYIPIFPCFRVVAFVHIIWLNWPYWLLHNIPSRSCLISILLCVYFHSVLFI